MTLPEFKAWFEGFTEAIPGVPTKAQWGRIKARVAEIDGKAVTERVFIDRYYPSVRPYYPWYSTTYCGDVVTGTTTMTATGIGHVSNGVGMSALSFNSTDAMADLGRADAQSIS